MNNLTSYNLHSNMFLLFRIENKLKKDEQSDLHSNMFLLFPIA